MLEEIWRSLPVPGLEHYDISDHGRLRRSGRILRISIDTNGYPRARLWGGNRERIFRLHKLVALCFIGPCPEGLEIDHIDGVKTNCAATNLEYVTHKENSARAAAMGLYRPATGLRNGAYTQPHRRSRGNRNGALTKPESRASGERHGSAKLTSAQVIEIRERLSRGESKREIASRFGVAVPTIHRISTGKGWRIVVSILEDAQ